MTAVDRTPWVQTTTGIVVVNGVVTAVVSAVVTWIINNATSLPWFWILLTFAGIAAVMFLGLSLFRERLRQAIWRRPWHWLSGLRVTSQAARKADVDRAIEDSTRLISAEKTAAVEMARHQMSELGQENAELSFANMEQETAIRALESQLQAATQSNASPSPSEGLPKPTPRWRFLRFGALDDLGREKYGFKNLVPNSVALHARVEAVGGGFTFDDAAFWEDLSGTAQGQFEGSVSGIGLGQGVTLRLSWYDENHVAHSTDFWIKPPFPNLWAAAEGNVF